MGSKKDLIMIMHKNNKKEGEGITLNGLFKELNELFKDDVFAARKDDPKFSDIKSMLKSLVNGEAEFSEEEDEDVELTDEELAGGSGYVSYDRVRDAAMDNRQIMVKDAHGNQIPTIAFLAPNQLMEGVVETIRKMNAPTIVAFEDGLVTKAFIAKGMLREDLLQKHGNIPAIIFDEQSGICRLSINSKDGFDFVIGENGVTRFIIFDETVCPDTIPTDIIKDDRKWGKRMSSELPKMIEQRIEESKSNEKKLPFADAVTPALTKLDIPNLTEKKSAMCNLPETCKFEDAPREIKKPIISDIMKDFADAKKFGKVKDDTFVEFMKPENKETVTKAVTSSLTERTKPLDEIEPTDDEVFAKDIMNAFSKDGVLNYWDDDKEEEEVEVEDTNPDCFRCVVDYMAKEGVDSIHFWTDENGHIHCDVQIKTVYVPELAENLED
jgi:hypothetical protein